MCIKNKDNNLLVKMRTLRIDKESILKSNVMENEKIWHNHQIYAKNQDIIGSRCFRENETK